MIKSVILFIPELYGAATATLRDSPSIYKIVYVIGIKNFLNTEGHQNFIIGSTVTAILLKWGFGLLVEFHQEGSAPAACAAI